MSSYIGRGQIGVFGDIGQFGTEKVGVFGSALLMHSKNWYAPKFKAVILYLDENTRIEVKDEQSYFETAITVASTNKILLPLGYEKTQVPLSIEGTEVQSIHLSLETHFLPTTITQRLVQFALPFIWKVQSEGDFTFKLPIKAYQTWLGVCRDCQWVGKTEIGWELLDTEIIDNAYITFKKPIHLTSYDAVSLVSFWEEKPLLVAEAITPNGDGINDFWILKNIDHYPTAHIRIFNALGRCVFESMGDYQNDWDGRDALSGNLVSAGLYRYQIRLFGTDSKSPVIAGYILIKSK
ncbi:MAG: gliding motility-associated C-terminal domain-containing protein [Flavobacteriaceae bacterium]